MVIIKIRHFRVRSLKTITSYHMLIIYAVYSVYVLILASVVVIYM